MSLVWNTFRNQKVALRLLNSKTYKCNRPISKPNMLKSMFGVPLSDLQGKCLFRLEFHFAHPKLAKETSYLVDFFLLRQNFSAINLGKIFRKSAKGKIVK